MISNSKNETLDSLKVFNNAFVINKDSIGEGYKQISGKRLNGLFFDNALETIDVIKNAETIYYLRNSEDELIGIDKSKSGAIKIWISENEIDELRKLNQIGGMTYPEEDFPEKERKIWNKTLNYNFEDSYAAKNLNKEEVKMKKNEQSSLMNAALHNAFMLEKGAEFSIIDLLGDQWDRVESPRAFGRSFRQALESSGLASVSHKTSDNKTIYKREEDKQNSMFIKAT